MLKRLVLFVLSLAFLAGTSVEAQPPRGGGPGGGRGGRGNQAAFLVNRMVAVEQVLSYLAFDDKIALKDDQLVKIRKALAEVHSERDELRQSMRGSNDMQAGRQKVMVLARKMNQSIAGVLDAKQTEEFKAYMKRMQERAQRGGRGGRGRGGEGRRRGGGDGGGA